MEVSDTTSLQQGQTQDIVTNDNAANADQTAPASKSNTGMPVEDLILIRKAHEEWVNGAYARSNVGLYSLLSRSLDAYDRMINKPEHIRAFNTECDAAGLKFKQSTSLLSKIVTYVFHGAGRHRSSAYTRVLTIAKAEKIKPGDLHLWIARKGGIEEVRSKNSNTVSAQAKQNSNVAIATSTIANAKPLTVIQGIKVDTSESESNFVATLARKATDGSLEVYGIVTNEAVVKVVLAAYGQHVSANAKANHQAATADSKTAVLADIIAA